MNSIICQTDLCHLVNESGFEIFEPEFGEKNPNFLIHYLTKLALK